MPADKRTYTAIEYAQMYIDILDKLDELIALLRQGREPGAARQHPRVPIDATNDTERFGQNREK